MSAPTREFPNISDEVSASRFVPNKVKAAQPFPSVTIEQWNELETIEHELEGMSGEEVALRFVWKSGVAPPQLARGAWGDSPGARRVFASLDSIIALVGKANGYAVECQVEHWTQVKFIYNNDRLSGVPELSPQPGTRPPEVPPPSGFGGTAA